MTQINKVSQWYQSTIGDRDVSARATHLKAVTEKDSMTTIERKIMSTKTTFKRVALVAVSALGLGLISAVPSQAAVSGITITVANGTKIANSGIQETTNGATVAVSALIDNATDTVAVSITPKSVPSGQSNVVAQLLFMDTVVSGVTVPSSDSVVVRQTTAFQGRVAQAFGSNVSSKDRTGGKIDSITAFAGSTSQKSFVIHSGYTTFLPAGESALPGNATAGSSTGYVSGSFRLALDTSISGALITAGTYTYTITVTPYAQGISAGTSVTADVSIVASAPTISGSTSTMFLGTTSAPTSDATNPSGAATASNSTPVGYIAVTLRDSSSNPVTSDTVIVTTTIGNVGQGVGTAVGKNVQFAYSGSALNIGLFPDGTSGTATITVSTNSGITFATKSFTFYSTSISTLTVSPVKTTLAVGSNSSALIVVAKDASGNWINDASNIRLFSDATSVVSETATAGCTAVPSSQYAVCTLTGVAAGTANIVVGSNTAKANATTAYKVTVTSNPIASIALTSNKTSYAPGEKAYIRVTAKDSAGNSVAPQTISNFFASGGISTDVGLGSGSDTLTQTIAYLDAATTTGYSTGDAVEQFTVYMPAGASSITFSATGGTGLPAAAQKAVSLTVSVTDSGAQALAAVTALASQVSAFITKINAQITTLTDLVMKIQKKVRA